MDISPIAKALWRRKGGASLIAAQVALTLAILCNALAVVADRLDLSGRDSGVDEAGLFYVQLITPGYDADPFGVQRATEALLRGMPGVREAAWVNQAPLAQSGTSSGVSNEDFSVRFLNSSHYSAGASLVQVLGLRLVQGRDFTPDELLTLDLRQTREPPSGMKIIVTRALAEQLYPGAASVVGRTLRLGATPGDPTGQIVGVVERLVSPWGRASWMEGDPFGERGFITPVRVNERETYAVRTTAADRARLQAEVQQRLLQAVPGRIVLNADSQADLRERRYRGERWLAGMLLVVTGLLLVMTAAGIVGLASLWVAQRRRQIGVRRALGARRVDIVKHFLMENLMITATGVALGLTGAVALNGVLLRFTALPPLSPALLAGGALLLPLLGALAVLGPALRAARVSPAEATRAA